MTVEPKHFLEAMINQPSELQKNSIEVFLDFLPAFVIAINRQGQITLFNKGAENLIGVLRQDIIGQPLTQIVEYTLEESFLYQTMKSGRVFYNIEREFLFYGRKVLFIGDAMPLLDANGAVVGAVGVFKDIQHQKDAEMRAQHLEALACIGQTAAGTVHEIRNPLTSIKGFTQLIRQKAAKGDTYSLLHYCKLITDEVEHIDHILSDFLSLAKPQQEKRELVSVHRLISDVLSFMYGESLLLGLSIIYFPPEQDFKIECHQEKIKEVLINLCRNAFQSMKSGGTLTVELSQQAGLTYIRLTDTGCGIAAEQLNSIFEPFYTTKPSGTGLGLAICQKIMTQHGGRIEVISKVNQGSTFEVIFPRVEKSPGT